MLESVVKHQPAYYLVFCHTVLFSCRCSTRRSWMFHWCFLMKCWTTSYALIVSFASPRVIFCWSESVVPARQRCLVLSRGWMVSASFKSKFTTSTRLTILTKIWEEFCADLDAGYTSLVLVVVIVVVVCCNCLFFFGAVFIFFVTEILILL